MGLKLVELARFLVGEEEKMYFCFNVFHKKCRNVLVLSSITLNKFLHVRWDLFLKLAIFNSPLVLFCFKFFQLVAFVEE